MTTHFPQIFFNKIGRNDFLKKDHILYRLIRYTDYYCEIRNAWKVVCVEFDYCDCKLEGTSLKYEEFYESDFDEYLQYYNFNPPAREPSPKTTKVNLKIEQIKDKAQELDSKLKNEYHWHRGVYKEELLRKLIVDLLKEDIKDAMDIEVGTGFVVGKNVLADHSKQQDIIIYKKHPKPIFRSSSFLIVDVENLLGTIEIKTKLSSAELNSALHNQYNVLNLGSTPTKFVSAIFSYENSMRFNTVKKIFDQFIIENKINADDVFNKLPIVIGELNGKSYLTGFDCIKNRIQLYPRENKEGISGLQTFYACFLEKLSDKGIQLNNDVNQYKNLASDEEDRNNDNPFGIQWDLNE